MANDVLKERGSSTAMTITLASLATSTGGVGRQTDLVTNASPCKPRVWVWVSIKQGTSPTSNKSVFVYAIRGDGTRRDDGAGASDAALTVLNAKLLGVLGNKASGAATGDVVQGWFVFDDPGPEWGIAIVHDTGVNLDSTGGNHAIYYSYENPEIQ